MNCDIVFGYCDWWYGCIILKNEGYDKKFSVMHLLGTLILKLSLYSTRLLNSCRGWSLGGEKGRRFL